MAKTGYKIDYIVRNLKDDLSDLEAIHQEVFPGNKLATWTSKDSVVIKVSNFNKVTGKDIHTAKTEAGYEEIGADLNGRN
jgi:hypothetical protein